MFDAKSGFGKNPKMMCCFPFHHSFHLLMFIVCWNSGGIWGNPQPLVCVASYAFLWMLHTSAQFLFVVSLVSLKIVLLAKSKFVGCIPFTLAYRNSLASYLRFLFLCIRLDLWIRPPFSQPKRGFPLVPHCVGHKYKARYPFDPFDSYEYLTDIQHHR